MEFDNNDIQFLEESTSTYGKINSFRDLVVWQKAMQLVSNVYSLSANFPESEKFGLTSQIRRCAVSVPSNIAEGYGRNSLGNYLQFLRISHGSICELETQLILCEDLNYSKSDEIKKSFELINEVGKMLRSLMSKLEQKK